VSHWSFLISISDALALVLVPIGNLFCIFNHILLILMPSLCKISYTGPINSLDYGESRLHINCNFTM
jgi:hypothetical protein